MNYFVRLMDYFMSACHSKYFLLSLYSFGPISFSRAYINFKNRDDIIKFRDQFDGYCFVDSRGTLKNIMFPVSLLSLFLLASEKGASHHPSACHILFQCFKLSVTLACPSLSLYIALWVYLTLFCCCHFVSVNYVSK